MMKIKIFPISVLIFSYCLSLKQSVVSLYKCFCSQTPCNVCLSPHFTLEILANLSGNAGKSRSHFLSAKIKSEVEKMYLWIWNPRHPPPTHTYTINHLFLQNNSWGQVSIICSSDRKSIRRRYSFRYNSLNPGQRQPPGCVVSQSCRASGSVGPHAWHHALQVLRFRKQVVQLMWVKFLWWWWREMPVHQEWGATI